MINHTDNSFFNQSLFGKRILVLAPHEDDEINIAGNMIVAAIESNAEVFVCFSTNGDYKESGKMRIHEGIDSLRVLGVNIDHIYFMGYGDSLNGSPNIFNVKDKDVLISHSGHCETYGTQNAMDYSYKNTGKHSQYNWMHFVRDLKNIIEDVRADIIFCVDYDEHSDHRMLALAFQSVIGEILRTNHNKYKPEIYLTFAYCLYFFGEADYNSVNLKSIQHPIKGKTTRYSGELLDHSIYIWNDRIRFPVVRKCRIDGFLKNNLIARALLCHKSQYAIFRANRVINGDVVYWKRRTDSCSYTAHISASSGIPEKVNDFMLYNTEDVGCIIPLFSDYLWIPDKGDMDKELIFEWEEPVKIRYIKICGNIDNSSRIRKMVIYVNRDPYFLLDGLKEFGNPVFVDLNRTIQTSICVIKVLETEGESYGISECEFYSEEVHNIFNPFIKITIDDDFIYNYYFDKHETVIELGLYRYETKREVKFDVVFGKSRIEGNKLHLSKKDRLILVEARVVGEEDVFDRVCFKRISVFYQFRNQFIKKVDKLWLKMLRSELHFRNYYIMISEYGLSYAFRQISHKLKARRTK